MFLQKNFTDVGRGVEGDEFWDKIIAKLFNDDERRPILQLTDFFSNVDSRKPALCYRSVVKRKDAIYKSKSVFTISHKNWSVSGQNDVDRTVDFVPKAQQGTRSSVEGKKVLILFTVMRGGTEYEDIVALRFFRKISRDGLGYHSMCQSANPSPSALSTSQKRMADEMNSALACSFSEAANKMSEDMANGLRALASAFSRKSPNAHGVDTDDLEMRKLKRRRTLTDYLVNLRK